MTGKIYGKQTQRPECGMVFVVDGNGTRGGIYTNPTDLRRYIKLKARQGWKLERIFRMQVANRKPHYGVWITKNGEFGAI